VLNGVDGEVNDIDVVIINKGDMVYNTMRLLVELVQPDASMMPLAMAQYSASALDRDTLS
jgi:hypothetical protein